MARRDRPPCHRDRHVLRRGLCRPPRPRRSVRERLHGGHPSTGHPRSDEPGLSRRPAGEPELELLAVRRLSRRRLQRRHVAGVVPRLPHRGTDGVRDVSRQRSDEQRARRPCRRGRRVRGVSHRAGDLGPGWPHPARRRRDHRARRGDVRREGRADDRAGGSQRPARVGWHELRERLLPRRRARRRRRHRDHAALGRSDAARQLRSLSWRSASEPCAQRLRDLSSAVGAAHRRHRAGRPRAGLQRLSRQRELARTAGRSRPATRSRRRSASARIRRTCRRARGSRRRSRARRVTSCRRRPTRPATSITPARRSSIRASAGIASRRPARARTATARRDRRGPRAARSRAAAVTASRRPTLPTLRR